MKPLNFSIVDHQLQLHDHPGAAKAPAVPGPEAQRLADMFLHMKDLEQVQAWGLTFGRIPPELDPAPDFTIQRGIWYAMIVCFCKCFGKSNGRFSLDPKTVYRGDAEELKNFRYFSHLRSKNLVHDENSMAQAYTLAVLNPAGQQPKVIDVVCFAVHEVPFSKDGIAKLEPLVRRATEWVHDEFDKLSARLKADLEKLPYDRLDAFGPIPYVLPDEGDATTWKPRVSRPY
jgi:hypothetical protein